MKKLILLGASFASVMAQSASAEESKIAVSGDFRYRHQEVEQEFVHTSNADRIRARFGLSSKINDQFSAGMRVAYWSQQWANRYT